MNATETAHVSVGRHDDPGETDPLTTSLFSDAELPLIRVGGEVLTRLPSDLYIPPDALAILLTQFEGPLDLLLYLIRKQNLDILDLPIADITRQYLDYLRLMDALRWELAAEYLVMAAWLAEIKSRLLLPQPPAATPDESGEDPRAELIRRLQEYERIKHAAEELDALPRLDRDVFIAQAFSNTRAWRPPPVVTVDDVATAFRQVMARQALVTQHAIRREPITVRQRMVELLGRLHANEFTLFTDLLEADEGGLGFVVTFLAALELTREQVIELMQHRPLAAMYLRRRLPNEPAVDSPP